MNIGKVSAHAQWDMLSGRGESDVSAREAEAGVRRGGDGRKLLLRHEVRALFQGGK